MWRLPTICIRIESLLTCLREFCRQGQHQRPFDKQCDVTETAKHEFLSDNKTSQKNNRMNTVWTIQCLTGAGWVQHMGWRQPPLLLNYCDKDGNDRSLVICAIRTTVTCIVSAIHTAAQTFHYCHKLFNSWLVAVKCLIASTFVIKLNSSC